MNTVISAIKVKTFISISVGLFLLAFADFANAEIHRIKSGDTLTHIMRRHGFSPKNVAQATASKDWDSRFPIIPGAKYKVLGPELRLYHPEIPSAISIVKREADAILKKKKTAFKTKLKNVSGKVVGSLISSVMAKVNSTRVAYRFMDVYLSEVSPKRIKRGSHFRMTVEQLYDGDTFIRYGRLISTELEYQGRVLRRQLFAFENGHVHLAGNEFEKDLPFYAPVDRIKYASLFQKRRKHPITGRRQPHLGIDFEQPEGAAVYSAQAGKIEKTGKSRAAGRYIVIKHSNSMRSYYNHLKSIHPEIKTGKWVHNGQLIGEVGCSGYCTKPHLHFAIKKRGRMINPIKLIHPFPRHLESRLIKHFNN